VTERWLADISAPLAAAADASEPAAERLAHWLDLLVATKRGKALADPELFATYVQLTAGARDVVRAHVETLVDQLERIIGGGIARGELLAPDAQAAARAVFDATARFHNPVHAPEWTEPGIDTAYRGVRDLVVGALAVQAPRSRTRRAAR
jgi:hypothetical protein